MLKNSFTKAVKVVYKIGRCFIFLSKFTENIKFAGIKTVFVRRDRDNYIALDVADMVENDETITGAVVY